MPISWNEIKSRALAFSHEWGDASSESADAKSFWDDFFNVFGVRRRRVATFEHYVHAKGGDPGFIDLFWPGMLVAEHKSRGKSLARAFDQAMDYFPGIRSADLPRFVIVSDFARMRIHDLDTDEEAEFSIAELHHNVERFGFIAGYQVRTFREQDPVNIKAAEKLARLHDELREVGYFGHELEVYLVRILFCLFAEDTGIFTPRSAFQDFIQERTHEDGSDLGSRLSELFEVLNTPEDQRLTSLDEQIAAFPYVNGSLFSERLRIAAFNSTMREQLLDCSSLDWGQVSPAIFGSLFQSIMDETARRNLGAHYTSEQNILKVIGPLFLDELKAELAAAKNNTSKLKALHEKLGALQFFDPACGCGNFLVITYREIRLLELEVIRRLYGAQLRSLHLFDVIDTFIKVNVDQFHGIEIEEWPAQIAQVALWLMDHQMNILVGKEFGNAFVRIPLEKSANIVNGNALQIDWSSVTPPSALTYVFGNPPFNGSKTLTAKQAADRNYACQAVKGHGDLDFVSGWYVKAINYIQGQTTRCALVSTNSITQGEQVGVLFQYLLEKGLQIHFAHRTFRWRNEARGVAAVHCVIIGFGLEDTPKKRLFEYTAPTGEPMEVKVKNINPYLADGPNVLLKSRSKPLCAVPIIRTGNKPIDGGHYLFTPDEKAEFLAKEPQAEPYFRRWIGSQEFLNNIERWMLWLGDCSPAELRRLPYSMQLVEAVQKFRLGQGPNKKGKMARKTPPESTQALASKPTRFHIENVPESNVLVIPRHSTERREYIPFGYYGTDVLIGDACLCGPDFGLYGFGILCSNMHMAWVRAVCGRIKSDYRYSVQIVYNNFPWPTPSDKQKAAIEEAAQAVLDARMKDPDASLADLYHPLAMPTRIVNAHQKLDRAVDAAYGVRSPASRWRTEAERVGFLFDLYAKLLGSVS